MIVVVAHVNSYLISLLGLTSTHLGLTKVHLGMFSHKLFQNILLILFVTGRFALPLHLLIVHHLFHHPPRLAIEFRQLRVFRHDLGGVDLGRGRYNVRPPVRPARLGQVDGDLLAAVRLGRQNPRRVIDLDRVREVALQSSSASFRPTQKDRPPACGGSQESTLQDSTYVDDGFLSFDRDFDVCLFQLYYEISRFQVPGYRHVDVGFFERLRPSVG